MEHRAIQIGLSNEAVRLYVNEWIQNITEITELAEEISTLVDQGQLETAKQRLPVEAPYEVSSKLKKALGMDHE